MSSEGPFFVVHIYSCKSAFSLFPPLKVSACLQQLITVLRHSQNCDSTTPSLSLHTHKITSNGDLPQHLHYV